MLPFLRLFPTETKRIKEFYLKLFESFSKNPEFQGVVRQKYGWNVIQQTLFLNIVVLCDKRNNWNDSMQYRAYMYSRICKPVRVN